MAPPAIFHAPAQVGEGTQTGGSPITQSSQKPRDMMAPSPLHLALRSVSIGTDPDGEPVTSAVMAPADKPAAIRKPLTGNNQVAMTALGEALRDYGRTTERLCSNPMVVSQNTVQF